jgi:hypothetical protein
VLKEATGQNYCTQDATRLIFSSEANWWTEEKLILSRIKYEDKSDENMATSDAGFQSNENWYRGKELSGQYRKSYQNKMYADKNIQHFN